jgi:inactivated superfamily I helicase
MRRRSISPSSGSVRLTTAVIARRYTKRRVGINLKRSGVRTDGATAPAAAIVMRKAVHALEWERNGLSVEDMVIILTPSERLEASR